MKVNMHAIERGLRVVLGGAMVSMAFFGPENLWFLVGLVPLITGSIGFCPLYKVINCPTCKK